MEGLKKIDVSSLSEEEYFNLNVDEFDSLSTGEKFVLSEKFGELDFNVSLEEVFNRFDVSVDGVSEGILGLLFKDYFSVVSVSDNKVVFSNDDRSYRVSLDFRNRSNFCVFVDERGVYSYSRVYDVSGLLMSVS